MSAIGIWQTEYLHRLEGEDPVYNWVLGAALGPVKSALGPTEFGEFGRECREKLRRTYPKGGKGVTIFPFKRIFMVVRR